MDRKAILVSKEEADDANLAKWGAMHRDALTYNFNDCASAVMAKGSWGKVEWEPNGEDGLPCLFIDSRMLMIAPCWIDVHVLGKENQVKSGWEVVAFETTHRNRFQPPEVTDVSVGKFTTLAKAISAAVIWHVTNFGVKHWERAAGYEEFDRELTGGAK